MSLTTPVYRPKAEVSAAEERYRRALAFAKRRLIGETSLRASKDQYLIELINHHARCIMMPRHLVVATASANESAAGLAEIFQVPLDAAEKRLRDRDLNGRPVMPGQNTER
jgi:hypothetical protein